MSVDLHIMMKDQHGLQLALYPPGKFPGNGTTEERVQYIKDMVLAASDELHEVLGEIGWKPWAKSRHINRDAALSEAVDTLQFLMNIFDALDASAAEVCSKLSQKHIINWQRINGYTGLEKCQKCKRALDDTTTNCTAIRCANDED